MNPATPPQIDANDDNDFISFQNIPFLLTLALFLRHADTARMRTAMMDVAMTTPVNAITGTTALKA